MSFVKNRLNAFGFAFSGIYAAFKRETHLKIHLCATVGVVVLGFCFSITKTDWCLLLICIGMVISLELINSSIESLCNVVSMQNNTSIKYIKDAAAGAVLIGALSAFIVALIVFLPYF